MKTLKEQFNKNGYNHKVLWRDEDYAITEVSDTDNGKVYCYEAFEIMKHPARSTDLMKTEAFESSPSNEQWGSKGYTVKSIKEAHNKINKIKTRKQNG